MQAGFIYVVTNVRNGDQYVGLTTKTVAHRWSEHKTSANIGKRTYLYSAIRKYGPDAFVVKEFVSVLDGAMLGDIERQVIQELCPKYNQTNGGEVTVNRRLTAKAKEKIRQGNLGKKRTPEQRAALSLIGKRLWATDAEYRAKALAALEKAAANRDEEQRKEAVRKACAERVWSEESRAKLSSSCMGRVYGPEVIAKMAATKRKAVKCNETGEIFSCREEATERTGVSCRTIFRDVQGENRKPAKGRLTFSYI